MNTRFKNPITRSGRTVVAGLFIGVMLLTLANTASAQSKPYGSFVIVNPTEVTLEYQVKWGDGSWKTYKVPSKSYIPHYTRVDSRGYAPYRYIRFDKVGGDGKYTEESYSLSFYRTDVPDKGKVYYFHFKGNNLDLHYSKGADERTFHDSVKYDSTLGWRSKLPKNWK